MKRVVLFLAMLLLGLIGATPLATATVARNSATPSPSYTSHAASTTDISTAALRGPPASYHRATTYHVVEIWSNGASARSEGPTLRGATTYDDPTGLVQDSQATSTTSAPVRQADGGLLSAGQARVAAETGETVAQTAIHGNSASSPARAFMYRLYDSEGNYLKTGISKNPASRYTKTFMQDKYMDIMQSGTRREMLNLERFIVERDPGPLNREPWAGMFDWEVP